MKLQEYTYDTRKAFCDLVFDTLLTEHKIAEDSELPIEWVDYELRNATGVQHPQIVL